MQPITFLANLCILKLSSILECPMKKECYPIHNPGRILHGFMYTVSGCETYHFKDRTIRTEPDSILYLPKGEPYKITFEGEKSECFVMNFDISTEFPRPFLIESTQNSQLKKVFAEAERRWKNKQVSYYPECLSLFYNLVAIMIKHKTNYLNSETYQKIADAIQYLEAHFNDTDLRIEHLAKMSDISVRHFENLFFKKFASTPKEYILTLKTDYAKLLLQNTKTKINDIATELGYSDMYHFSKIFKSKTGYSPSEYRKLLK